MIPHTLVLKPGLIIHSIYNGYWFWGRPSVVDLWHDLRAVTSEIRPDWDLRTPGLREAWNAGDLSAFHGMEQGCKSGLARYVDADRPSSCRRLETASDRKAKVFRRTPGFRFSFDRDY
jgi:hypothetical protein